VQGRLAVVIDGERNPELRLTGFIQSKRAFGGLVVAVKVITAIAFDVVVPSQRREIGLLVDDPTKIPVRDRLAELVARL
jgi:hypothetical protein